MAKETDICAELTEATGIKPRKGEEPQAFAKRLALGVDKLDDDVWKALSEDAQVWANDAVQAVDAGEDIVLADGMPGTEADEPETEAEPEPEEAAAAGDEDGEEEELEEEEEPEEAPDEEEEEEPAPKSAKTNGAAPKAVDKKQAKPPAKRTAAKADGAAAAKHAKTAKKPDTKAPAKKAAKPVVKTTKAAKGGDKPAQAKKTKKQQGEPRPGSKRAKLVEMLSRKKGATVKEICEHFNWISHTARGAISLQIKAAGYKLETERDPKRGYVYRIVP